MDEIFVAITGYEGLYEISNCGKVKSLKRNLLKKLRVSKTGYVYVRLCKGGKKRFIQISHLVWEHFGDRPRNGKILEIDHIDGNKQNNGIHNLQLLNFRDNTAKGWLTKKKVPCPTGVHYEKGIRKKKWRASIKHNGKARNLGRYLTPLEAQTAYQRALSSIV